MMTDMADAYLGQTLFIIGGHPSIKEMPLELLAQPGVLTMALNNVPYVFESPTFWLTADRPACFGGHVYHRADIVKFARIDTSLDRPLGSKKALREFPNLHFYELDGDRYTPETFFSGGVSMAWWKSVFPISLQLAWRLGFRKIYLVGCSFWSSKAEPYAWPTKLSDSQRAYSQLTYNADVDRLGALRPHFANAGLEVISCTQNSRANELLEFVPLEEAVDLEVKRLPTPTPLHELHHSSATA
jgi:hypothetical protein